MEEFLTNRYKNVNSYLVTNDFKASTNPIVTEVEQDRIKQKIINIIKYIAKKYRIVTYYKDSSFVVNNMVLFQSHISMRFDNFKKIMRYYDYSCKQIGNQYCFYPNF